MGALAFVLLCYGSAYAQSPSAAPADVTTAITETLSASESDTLLQSLHRHLGVAAATLAASTPVVGAGTTAEPSMGALVARSLWSLAVVLALIVGVAWLLRSVWRGRNERKDQAMNVLARIPLSNKSTLILVDLLDRVLVLGEGEGGPRTLLVLDDPQDVQRLRDEPLALGSTQSFAEQFRRRTGPDLSDENVAPSLESTVDAASRGFDDMRERLRRNRLP